MAEVRVSTIDRQLDSLTDLRIGLVPFVQEVRRPPGSPNFFHFRATATNTSAFSALENFAYTGGASINRENARRKAIGEAIERYSASIYEHSEYLVEPFDKLNSLAVHPKSFALYSDDQYKSANFPWTPFDERTPARWISGLNARTMGKTLIPACRVFIPYVFYAGAGEVPVDQPISTGLACHETFELAAMSAICEVTERDAFTLTWQKKLSGPLVDLSSLPNDIASILDRFTDAGYSVSIVDITLDVPIHTILSICRDGRGLFVVAASSSINLKDAIRKSLEELAHTRHYCEIIRSLKRDGRIVADKPEHVIGQATHLGFYQDSDHGYADFLDSSKDVRSFHEIASQAERVNLKKLRDTVAAWNAVGEEVYLADLTTPDVAQIGLRVVRAVIPGAHPLRMGHAIRCLGGHRLNANLANTPNGEVNSAPHPYP